VKWSHGSGRHDPSGKARFANFWVAALHTNTISTTMASNYVCNTCSKAFTRSSYSIILVSSHIKRSECVLTMPARQQNSSPQRSTKLFHSHTTPILCVAEPQSRCQARSNQEASSQDRIRRDRHRPKTSRESSAHDRDLRCIWRNTRPD
jgi:hypothetical protein